jgi:hypothetical protein
MVTRKG